MMIHTTTKDDSLAETTRNILTKEQIMQACVKQGFYRTPSCNEKLYLHHKSLEGIDPKAFAEYTDVKVLWLESNCLSTLECGKDAVVISSQDDSACVKNDVVEQKKSESVPAQKPDADAEVVATDSAEPTAPAPAVDDQKEKVETEMPAESAIESVKPLATTVDVFSSMYPTLRQLFLHGNMFQVMPDLHLFEKLDSVNLSDNFIERVQSYCPQWIAGITRLEEAALEKRKKAEEQQETTEEVPAALSPQKSAGVVSTKANDPEAKKKTDLDGLAEKMAEWMTFCTHTTESSKCPCGTLSTLYLKNNHLGTVDALSALLCYKNLSVLDLSNNKIEDGEGLLQVLERMSNLKALYLSGNPCVRKIANYRKTVISRCKKLMHLDDRPIFDDERRLVTAWAAGGLEAEKKERQKMKVEEEERQQRRLREFREMMSAARNGRDGYNTSTEDDTDSNPTPSSSGDEVESSAITRGDAPTENLNKARRLTKNAPPRPKHTEFYEMNYGSKSAVHHDPEANNEESDPAPLPRRPEDGEDGVSFGDFRVVPKRTSSVPSAAPVAAASAAAAPAVAVHAQKHQDPMSMEQVAVVESVEDDDEAEVWVPTKK